MECTELIESYVLAINAHDIDKMFQLMHREHVLIDSLGNTVEGFSNLRSAWKRYFDFIRDYEISVDEILVNQQTAGIFGTASGYYQDQYWQTNAACRVHISEHKIILWQVYADNEQLRILMRRNEPNAT